MASKTFTAVRSPASGALQDPPIVAVKRWAWAGWYARWEWRYLVNDGKQPWTVARVIRHYSHRLGHARVISLLQTAERAYQEPEGIPADILLGSSVLVPSTPPHPQHPMSAETRHDHDTESGRRRDRHQPA